MKQPKRGRLWFNDGSCVRLRPERPNHVWSYDFVEDRTHDGRKFRMLNVIDEFTRGACHVAGARSRRGQGADGSGRHSGSVAPCRERLGSKEPVRSGRGEVAGNGESVVGGGVHGQGPLRRTGRLEAL